MKKRIFIAINLPPAIKRQLVSFQKKMVHLPFRWTKEDNLHLTLIFIGYIDDDQVFEVCQLVQKVGPKCRPLELVFERICYGPPGKSPRMVWVEGQTSQPLAELKDKLEDVLFESPDTGYDQKEVRALRPHVTLGRLKEGGGAKLDLPPLDEKINLRFYAESFEIMESHLQRGRPEYVELQRIMLEG